MLDLEITVHRGGVGSPFRVPVDSAGEAFDVVFRYVALCWGTPVPGEVTAHAIERYLATGEFRHDSAEFLIVVKQAGS